MNTLYYSDNLKVLRICLVFFLFSLLLSACGTDDDWKLPGEPDFFTATPDVFLPTDTSTPEPTSTPSNIPVPEGMEPYSPQNPCDSAYKPQRAGATWTYFHTAQGGLTNSRSETITEFLCNPETMMMTKLVDDDSTSGTYQSTFNFATGISTYSSTLIWKNSEQVRNSSGTSFTDGVLIDFSKPMVAGDTYEGTTSHHSETQGSSPPIWDEECKYSGQVIGIETITTPSGSYQAFHLSQTESCIVNGKQDDSSFTDSWWAYGIGLVKLVVTLPNGNQLISELSSYTIP